MAAKKVAKTRTSPKQKLAEYKVRAHAYIYQLRHPAVTPAFSVDTYLVSQNQVPVVKKPNYLAAPELGAIVGTARQLGKTVKVELLGEGDQARLHFSYVDAYPSSLPLDLL